MKDDKAELQHALELMLKAFDKKDGLSVSLEETLAISVARKALNKALGEGE